METPFKEVEFKPNQLITKDMLNTLQANFRWLNENTPRTMLYRNNKADPSRSVLLGGRIYVPRNKKNDSLGVKISFGNVFDPTTIPAVTTGIVSDFDNTIFCIVNGPGGAVLPTAAGCDIGISAPGSSTGKGKQRWAIGKGFWVYWLATGKGR